MSWPDLFKIWKYATEVDPITRRQRSREIEGAGVTQPDAVPDIRADGSYWSGGRGIIKLRDSSDFIDLSSVTNRASRYKEYERLRMVPEIETVMTIYADEACVAGNTLIATPLYGYVPIQELVKLYKPQDQFLVYCYDFLKQDYTLGWAFHPRLVKRASTVKILLDNGTHFVCTPDHKVLLRSEQWIEAGDLKTGDELMPFYRQRANQDFTRQKKNQFTRIFTLRDGWKNERAFIDEWKSGNVSEKAETLYRINRMVAGGLNRNQTSELIGKDWRNLELSILKNAGTSYKEIKYLHKRYADRRRVIGISSNGEEDVYDLSVKDHRNFATDTTILHNCQFGDNSHTFEVVVENEDIKKELNWLFFSPKMLNMDRRLWKDAKDLFIMGDLFWELIINIEDPQAGICGLQKLPADSMFRIETIKGKLLEFQQSKEGPDYQSLARVEVTKATSAELQQATAIRFPPESVVHTKIGDDRRQFYPYGVSLIEPARGPAHQLRLMEDAMLVYRLSRAPERRVFYVDVGGLPPFRAEMLIDRLKDQLRKKKTFNTKGDTGGASSPVEERWVAPSQDEDFFIPIRPNANTRVETLPGAQNLGEIDDALYFRNKLFVALNFPKSYLAEEDAQVTRVTLSSLNVKFSKLVQRLQQSIADSLVQIALRHLQLRGFPEEMFEDLQINLTLPSHIREVSENDLLEARFNRALSVKDSGLYSDIDILTKILKLPMEEAKEMVARAALQKIQEVKLGVMATNPQLMGIVQPGQTNTEMGTESGGPSPNLTGEGGLPEPGEQPQGELPEVPEESVGAKETFGKPEKVQTKNLPEPTEEELRKYDMEIMDYSKEQDEEEIDTIELDDF